MILYVNACVRQDSRTERLAKHLLSKLTGDVKEIRLADTALPTVDEDFINKRNALVAKGDFSDKIFDFAKEFAAAETIVIAAPMWDLSFPAILKKYFEQICSIGVTFVYNENGIPEGLCKANKLYYVMTAGGPHVPEEYGYGYVKALCDNFYGITDTQLISAVGLDIVGADVEAIMEEAKSRIDAEF